MDIKTSSPFKIAMQATQKSILQYAKYGEPYGMMEAIKMADLRNLTIRPKSFYKLDRKVYASVKFLHNRKWHEAEVEISNTTASPVYQLYRDDIRYKDGAYEFSEHAIATINAALPTIRRQLASNISSEICTKCEKTGSTLPAAQLENGMPNMQGLYLVKHICKEVLRIDDPVIVGGMPVAIWAKEDNSLFRDTLVNNSFDAGTENILTLNVHAFKFIPYNRNANILANDFSDYESMNSVYFNGSSDYIDGIMADPLTGLIWNLSVRYEKKLMTWAFQWIIEWSIFQIPGQTIGYHFGITDKKPADAR